eukprot:XP_023156349.1 uncharacterized protein LOC103632134 [Zea mays]
MNIEDFHWYLAVLNAKKSEVHVLDSMGQQITDRRDLYTTLKGLERQIKLAAKHKELYQGKWSNLDVASWPVIEKITTQMQTDGVSCGLWMINYMEYWTGSSLSDNVTQDDITMFRFKLPAILWDSRLNTKKGHQNLDHNVDEDGESSSDVQIIDTPCELSKSSNTSHQIEPYISPYVLPAKVTSTNTQELMFVLCTYIMGIDNDKYLKKHWIQSTKPYPISLSLQKLKDILDVNKPMDTDCFNMAVRMIACNDSLFLLEEKYHYMDLQFCLFGLCVVQSDRTNGTSETDKGHERILETINTVGHDDLKVLPGLHFMPQSTTGPEISPAAIPELVSKPTEAVPPAGSMVRSGTEVISSRGGRRCAVRDAVPGFDGHSHALPAATSPVPQQDALRAFQLL